MEHGRLPEPTSLRSIKALDRARHLPKVIDLAPTNEDAPFEHCCARPMALQTHRWQAPPRLQQGVKALDRAEDAPAVVAAAHVEALADDGRGCGVPGPEHGGHRQPLARADVEALRGAEGPLVVAAAADVEPRGPVGARQHGRGHGAHTHRSRPKERGDQTKHGRCAMSSEDLLAALELLRRLRTGRGQRWRVRYLHLAWTGRNWRDVASQRSHGLPIPETHMPASREAGVVHERADRAIEVRPRLQPVQSHLLAALELLLAYNSAVATRDAVSLSGLLLLGSAARQQGWLKIGRTRLRRLARLGFSEQLREAIDGMTTL
mmetsp:Transcript_117231/g.343356  ORF Transcript_117231/g.343356 Transcript_117231/m.343356 type:complete len:320 (-) Transcript_117231:61-1020(-)